MRTDGMGWLLSVKVSGARRHGRFRDTRGNEPEAENGLRKAGRHDDFRGTGGNEPEVAGR